MGGRWFEIASTAAIICLSVTLVLLMLQNHRYREMLTEAGIIQREVVLQPGERLDDFEITTLGGDVGRLGIASSHDRYLLFVYSTSCPHCLANLPKWSELSRRIGGSGTYVVGISVHGPAETAEYNQEHGVAFYSVTTPDPLFLDRLRIPGVPATLLLSEGGIVKGVWIGELTATQLSEVSDQAY